MIIMVKVVPNAQKNELIEFVDSVLKVRVKAPPDKGKANEELIEFLSQEFSIPKSKIQILSGHSSRLKKIEIQADIRLEDACFKKTRSKTS